MKIHAATVATLLLLAAAITGCVTQSVVQSRGEKQRPADRKAHVANGTEAIRQSWKRMTSNPRSTPSPTVWHWNTGIPQGVPRAEMVEARIHDADLLAEVIPGIVPDELQLVSADDSDRAVKVTCVNSFAVRNFDDLNRAIHAVSRKEGSVQVDFCSEAAASRSWATRVEPARLRILSQSVADDVPAMRVNEDGNPWIMIREGDVRCLITARLEREHRMLQLIVSLTNCGFDNVMLPANVEARCDQRHLRCLSCSEVLDRLYDPQARRKTDLASVGAENFAEASEREDYLVPTNCRRLIDETGGTRDSFPATTPAFAAVPGVPYPGPAVLGDARALSSFLLQRQIYSPGQPENSGWIIFAGESLETSEQVEVSIDLGNGPTRCLFLFPKG